MDVVILRELYRSLGFIIPPFATYSAEEEVDYLDNIFNPPKYLNTLYTDIKNGATRFIFGERGSGKTALAFRLKRNAENDNILSILIDSYDGINLKNNNKQFLLKIIQYSVTILCINLINRPDLIRKLNKIEKEKLTFFIELFFRSLSRIEFENLHNKTSSVKTYNIIKRICNYSVIKTINGILSTGVELASSSITKSLGLETKPTVGIYKEYFPELTEIDITTKELNINDIDVTYEKLRNFLEELSLLVKKLGFKKMVIFFDRIDELPQLEGKVDKIAMFINEILQDTTLLLYPNVSYMFIIWSRIRPELSNSNVRFDKFKPVVITWIKEEIESILKIRLDFFSHFKVKIKDILKKDDEYEEIIYISNNSPRDLFRLLSCIYDEQANDNPHVRFFHTKNLKKGIEKFIKNYDFYSLYPKKGTKEDIYNVIHQILSLNIIEFKVTDIMRYRKISQQTAISHLKIMKNYNLIEDVSDSKSYKVIDPKLVYLIKNNIKNFSFIK